MLLGWREARQDAVRFPVWQFSSEADDHLLPGLDRAPGILREVETLDDWGRILFFLNPRDSLGRKRPLDLLRVARIEPVLTAALAATDSPSPGRLCPPPNPPCETEWRDLVEGASRSS